VRTIALTVSTLTNLCRHADNLPYTDEVNDAYTIQTYLEL